jgi:hypothetical protein
MVAEFMVADGPSAKLPVCPPAPCTRRGTNMADKPRDWTRYDQKVGNKIVHSGITKDPERREGEHQQRWPKSRLVKQGPKVTEDSARDWEKTKQKTITPERKK